MPTVTYLGPAGTFTEAALLTFADRGPLPGGRDALRPVPVDSPAAALSAVRQGSAEFACVAIESSVDGPVTTTVDALCTGSELQIYAETELDVEFSVMVRPGTAPEQVATFSAHPTGLQQVRSWLQRHLPQAEAIPASSNAAAAVAVAEGRIDAAAAPARAAELLGLETLASGVADVRGARTRFVLIGSPGRPPARTGHDRTSVSFTLPTRPGTLVQAMTEFSIRDIDLTRVESRPTRLAMGTYRFHLDCAGHIEDPIVAEALQALHRRADELRFLGSWPMSPRAAALPDGSGPDGSGSDGVPPDNAGGRQWVARVREGQR